MTEDEFTAYQILAQDHARATAGRSAPGSPTRWRASTPRCRTARRRRAGPYCLALGDDALIYSHRLQQWMTRLPELEEETAVANIALDLLGQARMLLAPGRPAEGVGTAARTSSRSSATEKEFRNVRLAEHDDRDFAELVGRLLIFSTWRLALFERAEPGRRTRCSPRSPPRASTSSPTTATTPRSGWSASATAPPLSHAKMQAALGTIWPLVGELFRPDPVAAPARGRG